MSFSASAVELAAPKLAAMADRARNALDQGSLIVDVHTSGDRRKVLAPMMATLDDEQGQEDSKNGYH